MTKIGTVEAPGFFRVTGEVVTAESCEAGDAAQRGYVDSIGFMDEEPCEWELRDVVDQFGGGVYRPEGDGADVPRWLTFDASQDDLLGCHGGWGFLEDPMADGAEVIGGSLSVHRPDWITDGSWLRVCRLLGWRPYRG
jgi:hypothetical protein